MNQTDHNMGEPAKVALSQQASLPFEKDACLMMVQWSKSEKKGLGKANPHYVLQRSVCLAMCKYCPKMVT